MWSWKNKTVYDEEVKDFFLIEKESCMGEPQFKLLI